MDGEWIHIRGNSRHDYADAVFAMYQKSYSTIGTHIKSAKELVEKYPFWELFLLENKPIAFHLSEKTARGIKGTLAGTDGSKEGRQALVEGFKDQLSRPFHYSELSGRPKELAEKMGLEHVPADKAQEILKEVGKKVEKLDEKTYRRLLRNVGPVDKTMYGHPAPYKFPKEWFALSKRKLTLS